MRLFLAALNAGSDEAVDVCPPNEALVFNSVTPSLYAAFGNVFQAGNRFIIYLRYAVTHTSAPASIYQVEYNKEGEVIAQIEVIPAPANDIDLRDCSAQVIGGKIYLTFTNRNKTAETDQQQIYVSNDGLTGLSFDAPIDIDLLEGGTYTRTQAFITPFFDGTYYCYPYRVRDGALTTLTGYTTSKSGYFRLDSNGDFVDTVAIHSGAPYYVEPAVQIVGQKGIALMRFDAGQGELWQATTSNGGSTWTSPVKCNLSAANQTQNAQMHINSSGGLDVLYMERENNLLKVSKNNDFDTVHADETAYNAGQTLFTYTLGGGYPYQGYGTMIEPCDGRYLIAHVNGNTSSIGNLGSGSGTI